MSHDPTPDCGGALIASLLNRFVETRDCNCNDEWAGECWYRLNPHEQQAEFIEFVNWNLDFANLAVIEVGTVPPRMERVACRTDFSLGNEWFYDDLGLAPEDWQPLYIIREDKP